MYSPFARSTYLIGLVALAGTAVAFGCSAGSDDDASGQPTGTGTGTGGSGGQGVGGDTGGAQGGAGGLLINQGGTGGIEECASSEAEAELTDLDIVILLDRSGSMSGAKWDGSVAALDAFVNDPASVGINAGIAYFPAPSFGSSCSGTCETSSYTTLEVPIGAIGQGEVNTGLISASMASQPPNGCNTPTYGGLNGVLFHATAYQDANPDHKVIVVLASDGAPNGCGTNDQIPAIAGIAQSAYNYNGVETYVIAISGSNVGNLNQIAAAGGTGQAYDVTGDVTQFSAKMAEIRAAALACEFNIPEPPEGETLDIDLVNVQYTPGGSTTPQVFPKKDSAADCGAGPGWYYDDNVAPTKILLCPGSCTSVQGDADAEVKVVFGCESIAD